MEIGFNGLNEACATFKAAEGLEAGNVVCLDKNGVATACAAGDKLCGVALSVRDGYASVQISGFAEVKCEAGITAGYQSLSANGASGVKLAEQGGKEYLVLFTDSVAGTCGIML